MNSHYSEAEQLDVDEISHKGLENRTSQIHRKNLLWPEKEFASFIYKKEWGSSADSRSLAEQITSIFSALGLEKTPLSHRVEKKDHFHTLLLRVRKDGEERDYACQKACFQGRSEYYCHDSMWLENAA